MFSQVRVGVSTQSYSNFGLNKRHWNTVTLDGSVPENELLDLIDHSYELVVARLPRTERDKLNT